MNSNRFECDTCHYLHHYCTCGTVARSHQPMTSDEAARIIVEAFGADEAARILGAVAA